VGGQEFRIDLLFYHLRLRCYVAIGIAEYRLAESLPEKLRGSLPSIEEIESALTEEGTAGVLEAAE